MSGVSGTTGMVLDRWRDSLRSALDDCFWPGPQPMTDPRRLSQLIGRDDDARDFNALVRQGSLVVLSGETGVGKSSLLNLGIVPQLERAGYLVLLCKDWASTESDADATAEGLIASKLNLPDGIEASDGFMKDLDDEYGEDAVLILDQFEELIRHQPKFYDKVRRWIENAISKYSIHLVISLREEYKHRLRDLKAGPYSRDDYDLKPLCKASVIEEIIRSGQRREHVLLSESEDAGTVMEDTAVARLLELWADAGGGHPWSGVGLLHLQALLYVLWHESNRKVVTLEDVAKVERAIRAAPLDDVGTGSDLPAATAEEIFSGSLAKAVSYKLASCRDTYLTEQIGGDLVMVDGIVTLISRIADHLASGGYKVDQEERHLARLVLDEELTTLGFAGDLAREDLDGRLYSSLAKRVRYDGSWLTAHREDLLAEDRHLIEVLRDAAGRNASSGPMMGLPGSAVLLEELRRYFFALEWLDACGLVRRTSPEGGTTMIALIHDGFGRGLAEWAGANTEDARGATSRLTATVGKTLTWARSDRGLEADPFDGSGTELGRRYVNLRWRSSRVADVRFRKVVFVNCDFRWTSFDRCEFEGVTFVNCLLDGVEFSNCAVFGGVSAPPRVSTGERPLPSFVVRGAELVSLLDRYRETSGLEVVEGKERKLISWTAGLPAVPASVTLETSLKDGRLPGFQHQDWNTEDSGLMICGGRLSSLMFANCRFPLGRDGTSGSMGTVALRHVAGTSLEFGEQGAGSIQLADVAVRGLTISPPVWVSAEEVKTGNRDQREGLGEINLEVLDSQLQNVWLSTPLKGRAEIRNSVIWQLFNANGQDDFPVALDGDSPNAGVINCQPGGVAYEPGWFETQAAAKPDVDAAAKKVDYQSLGNLLKFLPDPPQE